MKFWKYLVENAKWNFDKNPFEKLQTIVTTPQKLWQQLQKLAERYFPERKKVQVVATEFCLNDLALLRPTTASQKIAMQQFDNYWQDYLRLKGIFEREYLTFPANTTTRIEQIATVIAKATGFFIGNSQLQALLEKCQYLFDLTEREAEYLPYAVALRKIHYFCAVAKGVFAKDKHAEIRLAKLLNNRLLKGDFVPNDKYSQVSYGTNLKTVCDCLANTTASFDNVQIDLDLKTFVYKNNRNVFDTFCFHKFGQNSAEFFSQTKNLQVSQQYFVQDNCEIRKVTLTNLGANKGKFLVDVDAYCHYATLDMANVLCFDCKNLFVAVAIFCDNQLKSCKVFQNLLSAEFTLQGQEQVTFDVVTIFAKDTQELSQKLENLQCFGATRCQLITDEVAKETRGRKLCLTPCSNCLRSLRNVKAKQLNFSCQLGDEDVATFVDNCGNQATLLKGFVFGTTGEKVYSTHCGNITQLNVGSFTLDGKLIYQKKNSKCVVTHSKQKHIAVSYEKAQKTLFYFPLERQSKIVFDKDKNAFTLSDGARKYFVLCKGKIESFTTDGIECNTSRLRYKLSNNLDEGSCLAICFATSKEVGVSIGQWEVTPATQPLIQESLVSTYLNYVNGKQVFCLNHHLKRPTALTLAGICYTNGQFVKNYLVNLWQNKQDLSFYDKSGKLRPSYDPLIFDLACVYYATLVKEDFPTDKMKSYVQSHLLCQQFEGYDKVIAMLTLKKASQLAGFDKVKCLVEYANIKKQVCCDAKLYPFAQAIGALPLVNPSKERLKDLCNNYDVPKNWYYVSQLENLYGLKIGCESLAITPTVTTNVLEQFALNFGGKRIQTTFEKSSVQSMTLNGVQCFQPFNPYALKEKYNTLVIGY